jgi:hypothetical protein
LLFGATSLQCSQVIICIDCGKIVTVNIFDYLVHCRFGVDLTPYPIIVRIDRELQSHPAFIPAHPSKQPDFPAGSHAECA